MILESPNGVHKDVADLSGDQFTVTLARAVATLECAPYWHSGEKAPARLVRAQELVRHSRVILQDDRLAIVHGSTRAYDVTGFHCTCPQSQKGQSSWCVHAVAVKLARTMAEQGPRQAPPQHHDDDDDPRVTGSPMDDEPVPLPLAPVTRDERLAHAAAVAMDHVCAALPTPQEDRMPATDDGYIPEPDDVPPIAVMEAPEPTPPAPVKIPREFTVNIKGKTHVLYTGLVIAARHDGLVSLSADWTYNDAELSLAHAVCTFADGRRYEESGDASPSNVSKGISLHFRRVALTRAKARCLRDALGISECSVEELEDDGGKRETPDMTQQPSEQELRQKIWTKVKTLAPDVKTREAVEAVVSMRTGLALIPANYGAILKKFGQEDR
jgi:hypothetical protein